MRKACFLVLGMKLGINDLEWRREEALIDVEDMLYNEKKDEERVKINRKIVPVEERGKE
jgi:hypothetical protein